MNHPEFFRKLQLLNERCASFDALLYDCDGTLADSMPWHKLAYAAVAEKGGIRIDPAIIDELAGWPVPKVVEEINHRYQARFDPQQFALDKEAIYFEEMIDKVQPIDFVTAHLIAQQGHKKIAVVSGSIRESVQKTLEVIGVAGIPSVLVCAGETARPKPFPDPFLKAAALLDVHPAQCIVLEDAEAGVTAATAAGMQSVRIDLL